MKLYLENIGKLDKSEIKIDGITVIAGKNGTGKSTVGKSLYSIFSSFYRIMDNVTNIRFDFLYEELIKILGFYLLRFIDNNKLEEFVSELYSNKEFYKEDKNNLEERITNFILSNIPESNNFKPNVNITEEILNNIIKILFEEDEALIKYIVKANFREEFNKQIKNIYNKKNSSKLQLNIKDDIIDLMIDEDDNIIINDYISLYNKIIYIDDSYIVDDIAYHYPSGSPKYRVYNHREALVKLLQKNISPDSILVNDALKKIEDHINKVSELEILEDDYDFYYREENHEEKIDIKNASTGLKTYIIIKRLLENGSLQANGTIILDEPETHLHPDWQVHFAELIVLLNKYLGTHILINTHSPYFLRAIEVYSYKHNINNKCRYYISYNDYKSGLSKIEDVSNSLERIYSSLASAFDKLENENFYG